jgi:diaminohydroxyphosphoribosylaminopyrimidine deaminase/5-amino-6-(5-phosphoribosylamino)uracil reductase
MGTIVDWDRDTSQWSAVLAATRSGSLSADLRSNPLWSLYGPLAANGRDGALVIGQLGQSLDGRIATATGHSHYINGPAAIVHLHRLRALVDAVVVGVGTALADDPQLNVRHVSGPQPARVVIDPNGRLPENAACLRDDGARRIVVQGRNLARAKGVECAQVAETPEGLSPAAILAALRALGLRRVLVEGGAATLSRFVAAGCVDRLHVMVAPMIIGAGPMGLALPPIDKLDGALRPVVTTFPLPGGDVLFDCDFSKRETNS